MIKPYDIIIDAQQTLGNELLLCATAPAYAYDNGIPTSQRIGTKYTVFSAVRGEKQTVKVLGAQKIDLPEGKSFLPVRLIQPKMSVYLHDGRLYVTCTAVDIAVADKG